MKRALIWIPLLPAIGFLVAFGILGVGRGSTEPFADVRYWYLAGKIISFGGNPYDYDIFLKLSHEFGLGYIERYVYPPHSFPLVGALSHLTIDVAKVVWTLVNVVLLIALAAINRRLLSERETKAGLAPSATSATFIAVAIFASPFSANVIWLGQTTLIISVALVLGWRMLAVGRPWIGGALLGFATIKPQLSLLFVVWLVATGNFRALVGAAVTVLALSIPALSILGRSTLPEWLINLGAYQPTAQLAQGLSYNTNIKSLLGILGLHLPPFTTWVFTAIGVVATFFASRLAAAGRLHHVDALPLLICASLLLIFGRDYDLAAIFSVLPAMCWHLRGRPRAQAFGLCLLITIFLPHRWVSSLGVDWLLCWRIIALLATSVWLARLSTSTPMKVKS